MPVISKKVKRGYNHFSGIIRGAGDAVDIDCPDCDSENVVFEEYIRLGTPDESDLGIKCEDCGLQEDPNEYGLRFEPSDPDE